MGLVSRAATNLSAGLSTSRITPSVSVRNVPPSTRRAVKRLTLMSARLTMRKSARQLTRQTTEQTVRQNMRINVLPLMRHHTSKSVRPRTKWSVLPLDTEVTAVMEVMEAMEAMEAMEVMGNIATRFQSRAVTRCRCRSQWRNARKSQRRIVLPPPYKTARMFQSRFPPRWPRKFAPSMDIRDMDTMDIINF